MIDQVLDALKKYKKEQNKIINYLGHRCCDKDFIFANINTHPGYPILIKLIENRMTRLLKKANLNLKLTTHSLRHTHTSLLKQRLEWMRLWSDLDTKVMK